MQRRVWSACPQAGDNEPRASARAGLRSASCIRILVCSVFAGMVVGCNEPPAVNPWRDDSIPPQAYGTASSEVVLQANAEPAVRMRDLPPSHAPAASGAVPHYPLWWEDPFEDQGDNNRQFAWTWQDYLHMPYGLGRWMLNTMAWPVSAVVTPPGTPMVSDGVVEGSRPHDAKPGVSADPTASLDDFDLMAQAPVAEAQTPAGSDGPVETEPLVVETAPAP